MRTKTNLTLATLIFACSMLTMTGCGSGSQNSLNSSSSAPALTALVITPQAAAVNVGATQQFTATGHYSDGTSKDLTSSVTWSSTPSSIATMSASGLLKGVKGGSVVVTATSKSLSKSTDVTVNAVLESIAVTTATNLYQANIGASLKCIATAHYNDASSSDVTASAAWSSSNNGVVTVSAGNVTAVAAGTAVIQAIFGGISGSVAVTVPAPAPSVSSISISPNPANVDLLGTQQLTATGQYSDGSSQDITNTVSWTSSDSTKATIDSKGMVAGLADGTISITAASGGVSSSTQLSINPVLQSLVVGPAGPAVVIGGVQQFTATGSFNDGTTQDVTATVQWSTSDNSRASVSSAGSATGLATGPVTVTATSKAVSASTALNVVPSFYANLAGPYAFSMVSSDTHGPVFFAGAINADGHGNFTGVEDSNASSSGQQSIPVSGKYVIYPDGRGDIVFSPNVCHPAGVNLRFMLTTSGKQGSLIEVDKHGNAKGTLIRQNPTSFNNAAINGNYIFRSIGIDSALQPMGQIGAFAGDAAGGVSSGMVDVNDNGLVSSYAPLGSSSYSVDSMGRGTLQLVTATKTTSFTFYVIDSARLVLMETDPKFPSAGFAELQTSQTYDASSLSGNFSFLADRPYVAQQGQNLNNISYAQIGYMAMDGAGLIDARVNDLHASGAYTVGPAFNGRGTLDVTSANGESIFTFYAVSPTKAYLLLTSSLPTWQGTNLVIGEADLQAGAPYSMTSVAGTYGLHSSDPIVSYAQSLTWINFDGAGNLEGIADISVNGALTSEVIQNPGYAYAPAADGRAEINFTTSSGIHDYIFFVTSPEGAWSHGVDQYLDGSLDRQ